MKRAMIAAMMILALRMRVAESGLPACDIWAGKSTPCSVDSARLKELEKRIMGQGRTVFVLP